MRIDRLYVTTGFVWLIIGMIFGAYLGATDLPDLRLRLDPPRASPMRL